MRNAIALTLGLLLFPSLAAPAQAIREDEAHALAVNAYLISILS